MANTRPKSHPEPVQDEQPGGSLPDRQALAAPDVFAPSVGVRLLDGSIYSLDMIDAISEKCEFGDAFPTVRVRIGGEWHRQSRFETTAEATQHAARLALLRFGTQPDSIVEAHAYRAQRAPRPVDTIAAARFAPTQPVRNYDPEPDRIEGGQPLAIGAMRSTAQQVAQMGVPQTVVLRDGDKALKQREPERSPVIDEIIAQADEESVMGAEWGTVPL